MKAVNINNLLKECYLDTEAIQDFIIVFIGFSWYYSAYFFTLECILFITVDIHGLTSLAERKN